MQKRIVVLPAICILLISAISIATYLKSYRVKARGRVVGIRVNIYEDANLTTRLTEIDWGFIEPGETKNFSCYVESLCNVPAILTLETELWQPENASSYIFLSWDYDNSTLDLGEVRQITFFLYVSEDISGIDHFAFDIIVTAVKVGKGT